MGLNVQNSTYKDVLFCLHDCFFLKHFSSSQVQKVTCDLIQICFLCSCRKRKLENQQDDDRPYIKKPPNAFMLFLKEQRPCLMSELNTKDNAAVNKILGQRVSVCAALYV